MLHAAALQTRKATLWTAAAVMALSAILPVLVVSQASAAPAIQQRTLETTSAVAADTNVTLTWTFDTPSNAANIKTIEIEFCDTPLTSCTNVDGSSNGGTDNIPVLSATPTALLSGFTTDAVDTTARDTNGRASGANKNNQITIVKTNADAGANLTDASIEIGGFTNDETVNRSYYTRMRLYSDNPATTLVYEGVFAQSTSQTLTVNARVQERLDFCVGATTVNNATSTVGDCSTISGTSVDVGNVDNSQVNVTPVTAVNGGSDTNGLAFIRTNAVNGASIGYRSLDDTGSGALKVPGATCVATPVSTATTDQCFNTSGTQGVFSAGTERFGMTVAGINCDAANAYSCSFAGGQYSMTRTADYDGNGTDTFVADINQTATTTGGYSWEADPSLITPIATSAGALPGSGVRVVDNEGLILKFAATAGVTTPTGSYSSLVDYIATTTF